MPSGIYPRKPLKEETKRKKGKMDKPELFREYAQLKIKEKSIKARIEELNPIIKEEILSAGLNKLPTNLGNFLIKKVKRWTYSAAVDKAKEILDLLKTTEEADGTANYVEVEQLEFREIKENGPNN